MARLMFVANDAGYFLSHRLALAREAAAEGWEVEVAAPARRLEDVQAAGLTTHPIPLRRSSLDPRGELETLLALRRLFRERRPDVLHIVPLRSAIAALPAARLAGVPGILLAINGLGHAFTESGMGWRLLQRTIRLGLRLGLRAGDRLVVQNPDDLAALAGGSRLAAISRLVLGSGVDLEVFRATPEPPPPVRMLFAARLIRKKGVELFVAAAQRLKAEGCRAEFLLAGAPDPGNPQSITASELAAWGAEGAVTCLGRREDMAALLASCHLACLPSVYGEGLPKALIEAAAAGRAMIASDIPGCREVVRHEETGLLVPPGDLDALVAALRRLIESEETRRRCGQAARALAERHFGLARINAEMLSLYREIARSGKTAGVHQGAR